MLGCTDDAPLCSPCYTRVNLIPQLFSPCAMGGAVTGGMPAGPGSRHRRRLPRPELQGAGPPLPRGLSASPFREIARIATAHGCKNITLVLLRSNESLGPLPRGSTRARATLPGSRYAHHRQFAVLAPDLSQAPPLRYRIACLCCLPYADRIGFRHAI